jgi:hypothetical protein
MKITERTAEDWLSVTTDPEARKVTGLAWKIWTELYNTTAPRGALLLLSDEELTRRVNEKLTEAVAPKYLWHHIREIIVWQKNLTIKGHNYLPQRYNGDHSGIKSNYSSVYKVRRWSANAGKQRAHNGMGQTFKDVHQ